MTTQILNIAFGETPVSFRADGFLNATAIAKHFGKVAKDYLKTEQTKEYIKALAEYLSNGTKILVEEKQLVIVKKWRTRNRWRHMATPKTGYSFCPLA